MNGGIRLAVIVPVLNEAAIIGSLLERLQALRAAGHEVIVVDGGSTDATCEVAAGACDRLLRGDTGRARQMNAGAAVARADWLWFLHADTQFEQETMLPGLLDHIATGKARWGAAAVRLDGRRRVFRLVERLINLRSWLTRMPTGDQGIIVQRACFERVGGYSDIPLMEDLDLCRRLRLVCPQSRRATRFPLRIVTSSRRWERHGVWSTVVLMWGLRLAWSLGVPPATLASRYRACASPGPRS